MFKIIFLFIMLIMTSQYCFCGNLTIKVARYGAQSYIYNKIYDKAKEIDWNLLIKTGKIKFFKSEDEKEFEYQILLMKKQEIINYKLYCIYKEMIDFENYERQRIEKSILSREGEYSKPKYFYENIQKLQVFENEILQSTLFLEMNYNKQKIFQEDMKKFNIFDEIILQSWQLPEIEYREKEYSKRDIKKILESWPLPEIEYREQEYSKRDIKKILESWQPEIEYREQEYSKRNMKKFNTFNERISESWKLEEIEDNNMKRLHDEMKKIELRSRNKHKN